MQKNFNRILIFTDGACSGNPGPGGFGAVVVYPEGKVIELGEGRRETTNNRMEMVAALKALKEVATRKEKVLLLTDSTYLIRGITQWIWGWKKRGWKNSEGKEVSNKDIWMELDQTVARRGAQNVEWGYVPGHAGVPGNERCDEIAVAFSKKEFVPLYKGSLLKYEHPILDLPEDWSLPKPKPIKAKKKAHSYVSMVGGEIKTHKTWPECEARVKGRSGARFKKALSPQDEAKIKKDWSS